MWSREADAAASSARACVTAAVSSNALSSATMSPARTRAPFSTLMAVSWPPTSGATRTSVARTTPTMGAGASWRHKIYPPTPAARMMRPNAAIPPDVRLSMRLPPLHQKRRQHREREVDDGKRPQAAPVARHFPQACAQLIDADDAIDCEIRGEYVADSEDGLWNRFPRPGKSGQEQLRKARAEKDKRRSLGMLEPGTRSLRHEAGRQNEDGREREELQRMAQRREAV